MGVSVVVVGRSTCFAVILVNCLSTSAMAVECVWVIDKCIKFKDQFQMHLLTIECERYKQCQLSGILIENVLNAGTIDHLVLRLQYLFTTEWYLWFVQSLWHRCLSKQPVTITVPRVDYDDPVLIVVSVGCWLEALHLPATDLSSPFSISLCKQSSKHNTHPIYPERMEENKHQPDTYRDREVIGMGNTSQVRGVSTWERVLKLKSELPARGK